MTTELTALIQQLAIEASAMRDKYGNEHFATLIDEFADALESLMAEKPIVDSASALSERPTMLNDVRIDAIAYEIALDHICPNSRVPVTRYETSSVATICKLIKQGIHQALRTGHAIKTASEPSEQPAVAAPGVVAAREKMREACAKIALVHPRREMSSQIREVSPAYAYAKGGNDMSEDIFNAIRALPVEAGEYVQESEQ